MSCHDVISLDGKVHDPNRIDFLSRYLGQLKRAAQEIDGDMASALALYMWITGTKRGFGRILLTGIGM